MRVRHRHRRSPRPTRDPAPRVCERPRISRALRPIFRQIGVPEEKPFVADDFQREALARIREGDVLVSAPTGAGKTWIAARIIGEHLAAGRRIWYASPLKALSNSIYLQFCGEFGPRSCGIVTGDRKENPQAPVLVGTTEILRNQLYDAMHAGTSIGADLVILDEAHYLADHERGVVWEEVLIYLPARVRLLLLSATIPNAEEISQWLRKNRGVPNTVVRSEHRPVPLKMLFLFPDGLVSPLGGKRGLNASIKTYLKKREGPPRGRPRIPDFGAVIACLRRLDLLPAIFFLKSRSDCDRALRTCPPAPRSREAQEAAERVVEDFLCRYPHLRGHRQMRALVQAAVGSHHGGQLPYWKVLVERMMNQGLLDAIFSTSTVAAGVNFPARTVVLLQSDRYNGREFIDLTATEFHQMVGRAGRRGKDEIGFGLVVPGVHQDPQLIHELEGAEPEPILSQIHINFSMTLNLLLSHTPGEVRELLERSFAAFQGRRHAAQGAGRWQALLGQVKQALAGGRCEVGDPFEVMENIQQRARLVGVVRDLEQELWNHHRQETMLAQLTPGRLIRHRNGKIYVVIRVSRRQGRLALAVHPVSRRLRLRRGRLRLKRMELKHIRFLYDYRVDFSEEYSETRLNRIFSRIPLEDLRPLGREREGKANSGELEALRERLQALPCEGCPRFRACHRDRKGRVRRLLSEVAAVGAETLGLEDALWFSFKRHLRFLKLTRFVDEADRLTADGVWASQLRVDQPLLIAEAIRQGAFDGAGPEILAGGLAPFVWDRVQEVDLAVPRPEALQAVDQALARILEAIAGMRELKRGRGFESPPIAYWPAVAVYLWARETPWEDLMRCVSVDEGDLASLIMRTADHLRQVTNLRDTHPGLAGTATRAIGLIMREPVYL